MTEDQGKIPQKVRVEWNSPAPKQLVDRLQQEKIRQKQISEIRKGHVVHGRAA